MEDAVFQQEVIESINEESSSTNYESTIKNLEKREKDLQHRFDIMYEDRLNGILPEFMFTEKTLLKTNTHRQYKDCMKKD